MNEKYFNWLLSKVVPSQEIYDKYSKLLYVLHSCAFYYIVAMDRNRYIDGIDLRYRFGDECGIDSSEIAQKLDVNDCSVLEMMVALALRCEETIMTDKDIGDRTCKWFNTMIDSLLLSNMTNDNFDVDYVYYRLDVFMSRQYKPNGEGGLFIIDNPRSDLRGVEIWYQMCWYLDTII